MNEYFFGACHFPAALNLFRRLIDFHHEKRNSVSHIVYIRTECFVQRDCSTRNESHHPNELSLKKSSQRTKRKLSESSRSVIVRLSSETVAFLFVRVVVVEHKKVKL